LSLGGIFTPTGVELLLVRGPEEAFMCLYIFNLTFKTLDMFVEWRGRMDYLVLMVAVAVEAHS